MRIGILTLQGATNYGAVLQVLALREYLVRCGHEVDVIDYYTSEVYGFYDYHVFSEPVSARSVVSKSLRRRRNEREFKAFEAFRQEHLSFSARCETRDDFRTVCESYDAIICGSDQVWNPKANGGHNEEYFLGALDGSRVRKVAYAASFGSIDRAKGLEGDIARWLVDYRGISVREEEAVGFVSSLCDKPVRRVIDPSMLLNAADYERYEKPLDAPEPFILTYMLGMNDGMTKAVEEASRALGLPVVALGRKMPGGTFIKDIGPGEFLSLYRRADAVLTSSFHGTAFSLLYGKPFVTFGNGGYNSRMETLLDVVGQTKRFAAHGMDSDRLLELLSAAPEAPFSEVAAGERSNAAAFLSDALGVGTER